MRILIIGGTSLIGPHLLRELMQFPTNKVHTLNRSGKAIYCENSHQCDRNDSVALESLIRSIQPDVLIDMIPFTSEAAQSLVFILDRLKLNIPVVAISSIDVYSAYATLHKTEDRALCTCPLYENHPLRTQLGPQGSAYNKLSIEAIYGEQLQNVSILRLPAIYGWPDTTRISPYIDAILRGDTEIALEPDQSHWMFSRCLHKNAAVAISLAASAELSGKQIYNVAEQMTYNERQWIEKIARHCGWHGKITELDENTSNINWTQHFHVCSKKIRAHLGYQEKYSIDEGFADMIAFHAYNQSGKRYQKYY